LAVAREGAKSTEDRERTRLTWLGVTVVASGICIGLASANYTSAPEHITTTTTTQRGGRHGGKRADWSERTTRVDETSTRTLQWSVGLPGVAVGLLPWLPWILWPIVRRGGVLKLGGFEATIFGQAQRLLELTKPLELLGDLEKSTSEFDPELDVRVHEIETHVWLWEAMQEDHRLGEDLRLQVGELLRRLGNYYAKHGSWLDEQASRLGESRDIRLHEAREMLRKAVYFYKKSEEYLPDRKASVNLGAILQRLALTESKPAIQLRYLHEAVNASEVAAHDDRLSASDRARAYYNLGLAKAQERELVQDGAEQRKLHRQELKAYQDSIGLSHDIWGAAYNLAYVATELGEFDNAAQSLLLAWNVDSNRTAAELLKDEDAAVFAQAPSGSTLAAALDRIRLP
jgi:tetratricopeptide (TPR) repeat protein